MNRAGADLVTQIQDLERDLEELKTAQFTGQTSGMRFYDVSPATKTVTVPASTSWSAGVRITHKFTGNRRKPVMVLRDITLTIAGITLKLDEYSKGKSYGYFSGSTYFNWTPYATKNKGEYYEDIQFSTLAFSRNTTSTITISTQTLATDRGTDVITVEITT